jgi:hypothetical protein
VGDGGLVCHEMVGVDCASAQCVEHMSVTSEQIRMRLILAFSKEDCLSVAAAAQDWPRKLAKSRDLDSNLCDELSEQSPFQSATPVPANALESRSELGLHML